MTFGSLTIILLVLGLLPFHISCRTVGGKRPQRRWQIYATFWRLMVNCPAKGHKSWRFTAPLIQRLISAIWAALDELIKK